MLLLQNKTVYTLVGNSDIISKWPFFAEFVNLHSVYLVSVIVKLLNQFYLIHFRQF
jgi:hypothetical protein